MVSIDFCGDSPEHLAPKTSSDTYFGPYQLEINARRLLTRVLDHSHDRVFDARRMCYITQTIIHKYVTIRENVTQERKIPEI